MTINSNILRSALKNQYHAGLAMLRETIEKCPDSLWYDQKYLNTFWQLAYHTLYFTHLYAMTSETEYTPWEQEQTNVQYPDAIPGPADPNSSMPLIAEPYTREQVLAYWQMCDDAIDSWVDALDLESSDSGFSWYKISKIEHQLVNLRHLQHGAAQLADRLRSEESIGIKWVGSGRRK